MTTVIRGVLMMCGFALGAYGLVLLWDFPWIILQRIAIWAVAGVIIHDFAFAPACVAIGYAARRVLPAWMRSAVGVGALCAITLALLAIPAYDRPGAHPDNPTVVDRDYHLGLAIALAVVCLAVTVHLLVRRVVRRRSAAGRALAKTP